MAVLWFEYGVCLLKLMLKFGGSCDTLRDGSRWDI
jgi:hypothetical protein